MTVEYFHEIPGLGSGNIMWRGKFPMRSGSFPPTHPCCPGKGSAAECQFGVSAAMTAFRDRGYWASCFPEGDGITMNCQRGQTAQQAANDIRDCFGWDVVVRRGDEG